MAQLFVSDVHLDAAHPEATEQFLEFLSGRAAHAEALYILGDLFEAWIGDDDREPGRMRVCTGLSALTASGVACFVMHGNRDFLLGDALCVDDHAYQELRTIVRRPSWQQRFLRLPLATRALLAENARAGSRAHTARTVPYVMDVNAAAVAAAYRAIGVRRIIHGHTHRPAIHETLVDGQPAYRVVLGAWYEQGSYLLYEDGRYELRELPRG